MKVRILLFGPLAESAGTTGLDLDLPEGSRARDALRAAACLHPAIAAGLVSAALAINAGYARADAALRNGDELALIPPVSGG